MDDKKNRYNLKGKIVGLTGGIASGKSMVSSYLMDHDYPVVDFDKIVQNIKKNPVVQNRLIELFGTNDSSELREKIFKDNSQREKEILNQEVGFPALVEAISISEKFFNEGYKIIIWDAALLIESEIYLNLDANILIISEEDLRLKRLIKRDKISEGLALKMIKSQMNDEQKQIRLSITKNKLVISNNESAMDFMIKMNQVIKFVDSLKIK